MPQLDFSKFQNVFIFIKQPILIFIIVFLTTYIIFLIYYVNIIIPHINEVNHLAYVEYNKTILVREEHLEAYLKVCYNIITKSPFFHLNLTISDELLKEIIRLYTKE